MRLMEILIVTICLHFKFIRSQLDKNNFGPYVPVWDVFRTCKGPKQSDCGIYQIVDSANMSNVHFHLDFKKECPVTMAKITLSSLQANNKTKKLFNYGLDKPCQHFVLGPILIESLNLNNNCKINKGQYDVHLNMVEKTIMFLGQNFFYGAFEFKVMAFNKVSNVVCAESLVRMEKTDKS